MTSAPESIPSGDSRKPRAAAAAIILVSVTLLVMGRLCFNNFTTWDDNQTVSHNRLLDPPTLGTLEFYWRHSAMRIYAPLSYTAWAGLALIARMPQKSAGISLDPLVFHSANVLLHILAALVVCRILMLMGTSWFASLCGSLVFAIHPIQVEAVAWVSGLKDVLSGLLALLALWQYLEFAIASKGGKRRIRPMLLCIACLILAMCAKSTAATVPLAALAVDRWIVRRPWRAIIASVGLLAIAVAPFVFIARVAQSARDIAPASPWQRPLIAADAISFYLFKLVWPAGLCVDYGRTPWVAMHERSIYWVWLVPCAIALALFILRKHARLPIAAALVFVAGCLPTLGLVRFATQFFSTTADHYLYWAMLGPAMAAAWVVMLFKDSVKAKAAIVAVLAAFALLSIRQGAYWYDGSKLFLHTLAVNQNSALACSQLASISLDSDQLSAARNWAVLAIKRKPEWALPWVTLGLASTRRSPPDFKTAQAAYGAALTRDPNLLPALTNLAALWAQESHFAQAEQLCRRAILIDPADASAHINLGNILAQQGDIAGAQVQYQAALAATPDNPQANTNWAALLARSGQTLLAEQHLRAALQADPNYIPARRLLDLLNQPAPARRTAD